MTETDPDLWPTALSRISSQEPLSVDEAAAAMRSIMSQEATPVQVAAFLLALRTKGETVDEMEGFAQAALEFASPVKTAGPVVDTCGTGGDRSDTFNISTTVAIVTASWIDADLGKNNQVLYQCLKSRDQQPFDPFRASIHWPTRKLLTLLQEFA